ncbi:MAG: double zinc ribbon domain-containing protein [Pyrinomonadaceae bacterium]
MPVEALNCPNCGAAVASDSSSCEFCRTRLKTVACTKCLGMMFAGAKFCPRCGAIAAPLLVSLEENNGDCPRCRSALEKLEIGATTMRGCGHCDGLWMAADVFEETCANAEQRSVVLGYFRDRPSRPITATKIAYVPCPDCGQLMNRSNFARASGVVVDVCKPHGVWFDADELPSIIEFVQKGGMEIARQRELNEIRSERERLENVDRFASTIMMDPPHQNEDNLSIRSFVKGLFG